MMIFNDPHSTNRARAIIDFADLHDIAPADISDIAFDAFDIAFSPEFDSFTPHSYADDLMLDIANQITSDNDFNDLMHELAHEFNDCDECIIDDEIIIEFTATMPRFDFN